MEAATDPYTIKIFVPYGDPEGVRIIESMNWTGVGIAFPRERWPVVKVRDEFKKAGVYILIGEQSEDEEHSASAAQLPTLYIGQGDGIRNRIDEYFQKKDFWDWGIAFISGSAAGLNRAHITWLEHALIQRATAAGRSRLDNGNAPQEPALSESEKADTKKFLKEVLQILPLVGLRVFEVPQAVVSPKASSKGAKSGIRGVEQLDTIVVPANPDGFKRTFLDENCWYAIRISGGMLEKIKFIAGYQTWPISAITHYAPIDHIEPYGDGRKYKVIFSEKAKPIEKIPFGDAIRGAMQGPRYTSLKKLLAAKKLTDLTELTR